MPLVVPFLSYVQERTVGNGVVDGLIPKLHKALRCCYAFEDIGWRSIERTTKDKNPAASIGILVSPGQLALPANPVRCRPGQSHRSRKRM
jgi:hypothetical protein